MSRPTIKSDFKIKTIEDLPCGTYGEAMLLTETMEGWRSERPIIDTEKCINCNWCYLVCPEGVIYEKEGKMNIDYHFCKGCGICSKECKKACITMEQEVAQSGR